LPSHAGCRPAFGRGRARRRSRARGGWASPQTQKGPALSSRAFASLSVFGSAGDALDQVDALVRVAPLVVVPGDDFEEGLVELDAGFGVEHRRARLTHEVGRDDLLFGVAEDALHFVFGGGFHRLADVIVRSFLDELD